MLNDSASPDSARMPLGLSAGRSFDGEREPARDNYFPERRPGSRRAAAFSLASVPSPRPVPAVVSRAEPPRSNPGRSFFAGFDFGAADLSFFWSTCFVASPGVSSPIAGVLSCIAITETHSQTGREPTPRSHGGLGRTLRRQRSGYQKTNSAVVSQLDFTAPRQHRREDLACPPLHPRSEPACRSDLVDPPHHRSPANER